jgi:hypothetical protein
MIDQTTKERTMTDTEQEFDRRAFELANEIARAFPNIGMKPYEIDDPREISLYRMEASVDPIDAFNDMQRHLYARAVIREMLPLLKKLDRATRHDPLVEMIEFAFFMLEATWQNATHIRDRLQCERIEALAKEIDIARSKGPLTNDELIEAAGVAPQRDALNKKLNSATTKKERAALSKKLDALFDQCDEKIAKFLFDPRRKRKRRSRDLTNGPTRE